MLLHEKSRSSSARIAAQVVERPRLERHSDGSLVAWQGGEATPVRPVRCFPWSRPGAYISLRDERQREVALIHDPAELDPGSRAALEQAMAEAGFVLQVLRVVEVDEELEIRTWKVETRQGARTFQTARDEWPRPLPGGGFLVRDVAGDLYLIPANGELDARSQRALWAFID
ncbi:MAG TPA: DUF1854 domain-containing protein [Kofleriaceae bacterium]|nr:DUF1854 domain-containing protein [Kofleriaceae bacterium]